MSRQKSVLLMTRGMRVHRLFLEMAADLVRDHRVLVIATPEEEAAFASIPGVEVCCYRTPDVLVDGPRRSFDVPADVASRLSSIERALGLPLYKAASNYLLFARLIREAGGDWDYLSTGEEILAAYAGAYRDLSAILDRFAPDVVFFEALDFISCYVMLALAYRAGIFVLEPRFSLFGIGDISLAYGIRRRNIVMEHLYGHRHLLTDQSHRDADAALADLKIRFDASTYASVNKRMLHTRSPRNVRRIASLAANPVAALQAVKEARRHVTSIRNRWYLNRQMTRTLPEEPYIAFPLQHVPEAGICSQSPRWVRQDVIVEQLAINAPGGLRIAIKEHPRTFGNRGKSFFAPLAALPNVVVCHPGVDTFTFLSRAEAVVSITGTTGFEALLLGKRVGVLGRPFYSAYPGVKLLNYPDDLFAALDDAAWRPDAMVEERRAFLAAYLQSLYPFGQGETRLLPASGGDRWATALRQTMEFVTAHGLQPRDYGTGLGPEGP